jgi:signal peptidase I
MKRSIRHPLVLTALSLVLFLFLFWIMLAPTQLGGSLTYVIINGNSMEPGFYRGDLVLVRTEPAYGMGDAVVYRNAEMDSFVFHRIIGMELDRFILQGDNNSWLDSYQPVQDEIVGKLWVHVPKLGKVIEWTRVPLHMSLIVAFLGGVLMFDLFKTPSRRKKEKNIPLGSFGGTPEAALYGFGFLVLLFLVSGIYFLTLPLNQPAENITYEQEGQFVYSATGTPGVYDTEVVRAGEPVFPKLACFLNVGYTHNISGGRLQGISGSHRMYARIMDEQSGWFRTIPLIPDTAFAGNSYFTTTTLDLCQVESLVTLVEEQAGLKQISYTLEIITDTAFTANVDGKPVSDSFSPMLIFKYNKVHFYLTSGQSQADPLYSSKQGLVGSAIQKANTISLLGLQIPVWMIRFVSFFGFGLSLYGLIVAGMGMYRTASQSQEALIRLKYGSMLVDVYEQNIAPASSIIDVATMDDLVRLAERHGMMILHMTRNFLHYYFVQGEGTTYRYVVTSGRKGIPETEVPADEPVDYTEPVFIAPPAPEPAHHEASNQNSDGRENRTIYVYAPQNENTQPVHIHKHESQPVIADSTPMETIEYVINTGELEFEMPVMETTVLQKIKL